MHELSIALALVEAASEEAERRGGVRVAALHLRIGALAGIVPEALGFAFELAAADTLLAGARLVIESTPVRVFCPTCVEERRLPAPHPMRCPLCGTPTPELTGGRELELVALEISADDAAHR